MRRDQTMPTSGCIWRETGDKRTVPVTSDFSFHLLFSSQQIQPDVGMLDRGAQVRKQVRAVDVLTDVVVQDSPRQLQSDAVGQNQAGLIQDRFVLRVAASILTQSALTKQSCEGCSPRARRTMRSIASAIVRLSKVIPSSVTRSGASATPWP